MDWKHLNILKNSNFFLEELCVTSHKLLLLGDFNIHVDVPENSESKKFLEILSNTGMIQYVVGPTHKSGHTLDLLFSRQEDDLIHEHEVDPRVISDHLIVSCTINFQKPRPLKMTRTSPDYHKMEPEKFSKLLEDRFACEFPLDSDDQNELVDVYEKITLSFLDEICPVKTKER